MENCTKLRSDSLNAFSSAVWGFPEAVLKQDHHGLNYIDATTFPLAFEFLFGSAIEPKILVRREYEAALNELEVNPMYRRAAFITGQPGIGKTLFLAYLLVACLGKRRTVAWQLTSSHYLVLRDTATFHSLCHTAPLDEYGPLWALSDSNDRIRSPDGIFYGFPSLVRTIQATLPKQCHWKEWSKQAGAECYVMDIWSEDEIADLAKLSGLDVARMTALAKSWGGVPRQLLRFIGMEKHRIEWEYRKVAALAVRNCQAGIFAVKLKDLVDERLSSFYFCRPKQTEFGINRMTTSAVVPTPTLRRFLGEALQEQDHAVRSDFFRGLSQFGETRAAGGYVFESWFHIYMSAAKSIRCHWMQGLNGITSLAGTPTLIPSTWAAVKAAHPPCYWVAPKSCPGIDSALVLDKEIYVFQVTISPKRQSPFDGLQKLRDHLPAGLKNLLWRVVFIGDEDRAIEAVAHQWVGNLFFPTGQAAPIGWSEVDPVMAGTSYRVCKVGQPVRDFLTSYKEIREESDPDDSVSMENAME